MTQQAQGQDALDFGWYQWMNMIAIHCWIFQCGLFFERDISVSAVSDGSLELSAHGRGASIHPSRHWNHNHYGEDGKEKRV